MVLPDPTHAEQASTTVINALRDTNDLLAQRAADADARVATMRSEQDTYRSLTMEFIALVDDMLEISMGDEPTLYDLATQLGWRPPKTTFACRATLMVDVEFEVTAENRDIDIACDMAYEEATKAFNGNTIRGDFDIRDFAVENVEASPG
jgi:hypothetical protein